MTERRRVLGYLVGIAALVGIVGAAVPFVRSLAPSEQAKADHVLLIKYTEIPPNTYKEVQWYWRRILVSRTPELRVLSIPYFDEAYRLPDPTWERALIPCKDFRFTGGAFQCFDTAPADSRLAGPLWDASGRSLKKDVPDMQTVSYGVQGENLVFGSGK